MTTIVSTLIDILLDVLEGLTYQIGGSLHVTLHRGRYAPRLAVAPDLLNTKSARSLAGRGLSSLFKTEHALVLIPTPELMNSSSCKREEMMQEILRACGVVSGVAH